MTILIQGMRRSGTTILYDALLEDPELHCFYEPLRENTETPGGGSDARASDPFAETKALREAYAAANNPELPIEEFNWGGPRDGALEIGPELPDHCTGFLADLLSAWRRARGDGQVHPHLRQARAGRTARARRRPRARRPRPASGRRIDDDGTRPQAGGRLRGSGTVLLRDGATQALVLARDLQGAAGAARVLAGSGASRTSSGSCSSGATPSRAPMPTAGACSATATCCSATRSCAPTPSPRSTASTPPRAGRPRQPSPAGRGAR